MLMWTIVYYAFIVEVIVCLLLMLFSYFPIIIRKPMASFMRKINSPALTNIMIFTVIVLTLAFAESIRAAAKHRHHDHHHADKMNHDIKKFRAERNSYLSFGTLFLALIISQFWSLLNRILSLEESESKKTMVHEALVKQVKNREAQSGLVEVAKGLKEYESTGNVTEDKESLIKTITALQAEIKQLRANAAGR